MAGKTSGGKKLIAAIGISNRDIKNRSLGVESEEKGQRDRA
jgi:hypothetical protein